MPNKSICIALFIVGQCLHGVAGITIQLLSITYIFDHVPTFSSGLYLAIADAAITLGYTLGYLLGVKSFMLPVKEAMQAVGHVQRFRILQSGWWKSFIFVGSLSLCTTLPLLCFPSNLPGANKLRLEKRKEPPRIDRRLKDKEIKPNLKGVLHATWVFYNCSCIKEGLTSPDDEGQYIDAVSGTCNSNCLSLPLFFAFYFSATVFSNLCSIPALMIIVESVPTSWNSMSLGVMYTIWRFIGAIPAPIFFAETSALCCSFWDIDECGIKVRCWIYKKKQLAYTFVAIWISMQVATSLLCIYAVSKHDYVVKENTESLNTPVKSKKAKKEDRKD